MEDDRGAASTAARASSSAAATTAPPSTVSAPLPPALPASSYSPPKEPKEEALPQPPAEGQRLRFSVELKPGETTIVSWKRLLKESAKESRSPSHPFAADPVVCPQAVPAGSPAENESKDAIPPPNRFSAVIEKIERLYMGNQSSDEEELDDIPDDDQYDTEDSFIDDTELDEYFQVDKLATKHDGYFVNKGKLEQIEPSSSPKEVLKKRRRKDSTKHQGDDGNLVPIDTANMGNVRMEDAARSAPLVGRKLSSPTKVLLQQGEHFNEGRLYKHKPNACTGIYKKKSSQFTIKSEHSAAPRDIVLSLPLEPKDFDRHKPGVLVSKDIAHRSKGASDSLDPVYQASRSKGQVGFQSKKFVNGENDEVSSKIRHKERYRSGDFSGMSSSGNAYPFKAEQQSSMRIKEGLSVRPKGTTLERAIRDLQKIVAESRPPTLDVQDADPAFQGVKRRLPQEIKQKLAKVARLSASQGKISEELIDHLMGIVGHLVQRKTLKRHLREMVESGLSAKQEKADRLQHIKKEVYEMIRARVSVLKSQQDVSVDDFQEVVDSDERRALRGRCSMDTALEDRICDLYDLYVEGMDEDKGPQARKLYVELAELWPAGYMNNRGIKNAIDRSKLRKKAFDGDYKVRDEEKIKRKRLALVRIDETRPGAQVLTVPERQVVDSMGQILASNKLVSSQPSASTGRLTDLPQPSSDSGHFGLKNTDKYRGNMSTIPENASKPFQDVKKKMKRKSESDMGEIYGHLQKVLSHDVMEKHKSNVNHPPKPSLELHGIAGPDQPS